MMLDLTDVTVVISIKLDSAARLENLSRIESYYRSVATNAEILVVEQGHFAKVENGPIMRTHFIADDGLHWKTRNMNLGAALSRRPFLLFSDCDIVPHPEALAEGLQFVRSGGGIISLYDGVVVNVADPPDEIDMLFFEGLPKYDRSEITADHSVEDTAYAPLYGAANHTAIGGCFLAARSMFFTIGGMNPNIVSYGFEDQEFIARAEKLTGTVPLVSKHHAYHFDHPRGMESRYGQFYRQNQAEFERIAAMSAGELKAYVARGFRQLRFEPGYDYTRFTTREADGWHRMPDPRTDLSELVFLAIADPSVVTREESCLNPLLDHLEAHYWGYDFRLCENRTRTYKNPHNRTNVAFTLLRDGPSRAELKAVALETGRKVVSLLHLGPKAEAEFDVIRKTLDRVRTGTPVHEVFPDIETALRDV